jgi:hypothetical protein
MEKTEVDDLKNGMEKERCKINYFQAVLRIRIRIKIRVRRIRIILGLLDPDPSSLVKGMDPDPDPAPAPLSPSKNSKKNPDFYCFVTSFLLFIFEK